MNLTQDIEKIQADITECLEEPYGTPKQLEYLAHLIVVKDELEHRLSTQVEAMAMMQEAAEAVEECVEEHAYRGG